MNVEITKLVKFSGGDNQTCHITSSYHLVDFKLVFKARNFALPLFSLI